MNKKTLALCLAVAACTHPADVSRSLTEVADKNAKFTVSEVPDGFTVEVRYSRYQFVPETSALLTACRSLAISRAYDEAKRRGREIEPLNEQTIRVSTRRRAAHPRLGRFCATERPGAGMRSGASAHSGQSRRRGAREGTQDPA